MSLSPRLPIELLSLIPTFLDAQSDAKVLQTLSLTSRLFLKPCQALLFNHIILMSPTPNATIPEVAYPGVKLLKLLENSPRVSKYIKKISVLETDFSYGWLAKDRQALPRALKKIDRNQITSFHLQPLHWYSIPIDVRAAFVGFCRSTSLLELLIVRTPLALLGVCGPSLKHFEARDTDAEDDDQIRSMSRRPASELIVLESLCMLQYLGLDKHVAYFMDPANRIRLDKLTKLDILGTSAEDDACASEIISHCQSSLKTLTYEPFSDVSEREVEGCPLSLSDCASLASLELRIYATYNFRHEWHCLHWAAFFMSRIPAMTSNSIQSLSFTLKFNLDEVPGGLNGHTGNLLYHYLRTIAVAVTDVASTKDGKWKSLEEFKVEIQSLNTNDDEIEEVRLWALNALKPVLESTVRFNLITLLRRPIRYLSTCSNQLTSISPG
ncbi:hypothetical protein DFP72DRAFT_222490 [Ephemerocybe angulata]|uniref:F-box domain-containing protein n=1 Tax=Ephemerocybe angulata TaxID=980116 RepID=A0A8H6I4C6_9AGAR|nr:hypothetical protein DFP72DRAFT_222490 [Tulosesus angulatus]